MKNKKRNTKYQIQFDLIHSVNVDLSFKLNANGLSRWIKGCCSIQNQMSINFAFPLVLAIFAPPPFLKVQKMQKQEGWIFENTKQVLIWFLQQKNAM